LFVANRTPETAVFRTAEPYDLGVLTFGPLASGWLSGRTDLTAGRRASLAPAGFDLANPANQDKLTAVDARGDQRRAAGRAGGRRDAAKSGSWCGHLSHGHP
jgi:aryl-alcohol dehydrogenase-like predicted oxidoreductase